MVSQLLTSVVLAGSVRPSAQLRDTTFQYPLQLLDLGITASSTGGVLLLASPSLGSKQGNDSTVYAFLSFHPDTLLEWINHASAALRQAPSTSGGDQIQWSRELQTISDSGHFAVGRSVKDGKLQDARWLALADRAHGWTLKLSGTEADSLLNLLFVAGARAGVTDSLTRSLPADSVDTPVQATYQPKPSFRAFGRAFARYAVETDGSVDPTSVVILLASDPVLVTEARNVILRSRFKPAIRRGQPVRQLVVQSIQWRVR